MIRIRLLLRLSIVLCCAAAAAQKPLRIGIIGLDTSHVTAFTRLFNDPKAKGDLATMRVTAAFPGGTDIKASKDRVAGFTKQIRELGVTIVGSITELLPQVDVVLLESVDGRPHYVQASQVIASGKPLFIDKPLAGSLRDVLRIDALAKAHKVPWFSSSSLRFGAAMPKNIGAVVGCAAWSPCTLEPTHPDLFWYGIHGVESLFTVMGTGCASVTRVQTKGTDVVVGVWQDGRIGTFRGVRTGKRTYGATVFGSKATAQRGPYEGYAALVDAIARFFRTGKPPVPNAETIEIYAFMAAAEESKKGGGIPVSLAGAIRRARR